MRLSFQRRSTFCLLVTFCWIFVPRRAGADEPSRVLLARVAAHAAATKTLKANILLTRKLAGKPDFHMAGTVLLRKPNYAVIQLAGNDDGSPTMLVSDGTTLFSFANATTYSKASIDANAKAIAEPWWALPLRYFFTQSYAVFGDVVDPKLETTFMADETVNGETFRVVEVAGTVVFPYKEKLYIDKDDVLRRTYVDFGPNSSFAAELTQVQANRPIAASVFHFVPPAKAVLKQSDLAATMLAVGEVTPGFRLPSVAGPAMSLESVRDGSKATLVNFWYLDCPPCRIENPEFEKLFLRMQTQGLRVVAIDKGDSAAPVQSYAQKTGLTYPILLGGDQVTGSVFSRYRVTEFPATYLLDAEGKVVYRAVGEDLAGLRKALEKLGLK